MAYKLVRLEMCATADLAGVVPNRVSFIASLHMIRDGWLWLQVTKPGAIPQRLEDLHNRIERFILPELRRKRRYPREVKAHRRKFPVKKAKTADKGAEG